MREIQVQLHGLQVPAEILDVTGNFFSGDLAVELQMTWPEGHAIEDYQRPPPPPKPEGAGFWIYEAGQPKHYASFSDATHFYGGTLERLSERRFVLRPCMAGNKRAIQQVMEGEKK